MYKLDNKINDLEIRAAYNFDELTPRPNLNVFENILNLEYESNQLSTKLKLDAIF